MKYIVSVIRKDGKVNSTIFEGYAAETCADQWMHKCIEDKNTMYALQVNGDGDIRQGFNREE